MTRRLYLDSSALLKLVQREAESDALAAALGSAPLASSEIALVEVGRRARARSEEHAARVRRLFESAAIRPVDHYVIERAIALEPPHLRALDAVQLATALLLDSDVFFSYDLRLNDAARAAGLNVESPA